jgi:hypothetical protein
MKRTERNFIDFIVDSRDDETLITKFLECKTEQDLQKLFGEKYIVSEEDCSKLIKAKSDLGLDGRGPIPPAY